MLERLFPTLARLAPGEKMALIIVGLALFGFGFGAASLVLGKPLLF